MLPRSRGKAFCDGPRRLARVLPLPEARLGPSEPCKSLWRADHLLRKPAKWEIQDWMRVDAWTDGSERSVVRLHRRQFVIRLWHLAVRADWQHRALDGATHLSHVPKCARANPMTPTACSGLCSASPIETIEDCPDPLLVIARTPSAGVPELYTSRAGRWVLVGGGAVHMDASGLLWCVDDRSRTAPTVRQQRVQAPECLCGSVASMACGSDRHRPLRRSGSTDDDNRSRRGASMINQEPSRIAGIARCEPPIAPLELSSAIPGLRSACRRWRIEVRIMLRSKMLRPKLRCSRCGGGGPT